MNSKIDNFSNRLSLIALIFSGIFAFSTLIVLFGKNETKFDELGIGKNSKVINGQFKNRPAWCGPGLSSEKCYVNIRKEKNRCRLAIFGFSQLYVINNYKEGQEPLPLLLSKSLDKKGIDIFSIAGGNISPREELITLELLIAKADLNGVIIPAWLQGMMIEGIRPEIKETLSIPSVRKALLTNDVGINLLTNDAELNLNNEKFILKNKQSKILNKTTQELFEKRIVKYLEDKFALWRLRGEAQGKIAFFLKEGKSHILKLRNWLLRADDKEWVNIIPPTRYEINFSAKKLLLQRVKDNNLNGIVYIPPKPIKSNFPFEPKVYNMFKKDMQNITKNNGLSFFNLENSVIGEVWGSIKNGAGKYVTDHNHFSHSGHLQLAEILEKKILSSGICKNKNYDF